jgi:RluA family pseudouridine synthase
LKLLSSHIVSTLSQEIRFIDYALDYYREFYPSRNGLKKAIAKGAFYINDVEAGTGTWMQENQKVDWYEVSAPKLKEYNLDLDIVFEDDALALIYKPAGILVSGNQFKTISNALSGNLKRSSYKDALEIPRSVHRLDRLTSGLLLVAKTSTAQIELSKQFETKTIRKRYRAIVKGSLPESGNIDSDISGQKAQTKFKLIDQCSSLQNGTVSLVDLMPLTGRTHQLRIHMSEQGNPIVGDKLYTPVGEVFNGKGLFLSAVELEFIHPLTKEKMLFQVDQPHKFKSFLEREERRWFKYHKME